MPQYHVHSSVNRPRGLKYLSLIDGSFCLSALVIAYHWSSDPCDPQSGVGLYAWLLFRGYFGMLWAVNDFLIYYTTNFFEKGTSRWIPGTLQDPKRYAVTIGIYDGIWWLVALGSFSEGNCLPAQNPLSVITTLHLCWYGPHFFLRYRFVQQIHCYMEQIIKRDQDFSPAVEMVTTV